MGAGGFGGQPGIRFTIEADDRASPELRKFVGTLGTVEGRVGRMAAGFTTFQAKLVTFAAGFNVAANAARAAASIFDQLIGSTIRQGEELQRLSRRLAIPVETLSKFSFAAKQADVDLGGLGLAVQSLRKALTEAQRPGTDAQKLFAGIGVGAADVARILKQDTAQQLLSIIKILERYDNDTNRNLTTQRLFARGFQTINQLVEEGSRALEENIGKGTEWSKAQVDAADAVGDAFGELGESWERFKKTLFIDSGILQPLQDLLNLVNALTSAPSGAGMVDAQIGMMERYRQSLRDLDPQARRDAERRAKLNLKNLRGQRGLFDLTQGIVPGAAVAAPGSPIPTPEPPPTGGGTDRAANDAARAAEQLADRLQDLRNETILLRDPTQKLAIEEAELVRELTALAQQAKLPIDGIAELAAEHRKAAEEAEAHKKALEELEKQTRFIAGPLKDMQDRLRLLRGEITEDQLAVEKFAASAPEALRETARAVATETLAIERQVQSITQAFDAGGRIVADFFEGIILGTRSAGESLQAFKGILARTLIQGLLDVAKAAAISSVTGAPVSVQGAGGALIGAIGGLANGGGFGGAFSGAVQGAFGGGASLGGGGGGGFKIPSTFGIGSIAQRILGIGAGSTAGAFGAGGFLFNLPAAALGSAGSGLVLPVAGGALVPSAGFSAAQSSFQLGAAGAAPSAPTSALSGLAGYAGLALALGLGAKGIADTRSSYSNLTQGTSNAALNRLTGVQGATIAAFTGGGAAIGSVVPGIGTVIGAGVGAAVGAAVSDAIAQGTLKGISSSLQKGLGQQGLEDAIVKELEGDLILNILSGGQNAAFAAQLFGPLVAPDINRIFGKVFRQTLGGRGGLDTTGVTVGNRGSFGLPELRGDAGTASRIIAQAIGAGGAAFGERREEFISILLGGLAKRMKQSGGEGADLLAEAFIGAFNGRFFKTLRTIGAGNLNAVIDDTNFAVEQFKRASPSFGLDFGAIARNVSEVGVPGGKAIKESRQAVGEAFKAALTDAADSDAFRKGLSKSFTAAFVERSVGALVQGPLGEAFADIFAVSRENKRPLRRAKRRGDTEAILAITTEEFQADVAEFAKRVSDPAFVAATRVLNDELLKLSLNVSVAGGNVAEAVDTLTARLAPFIATVRDAQQLRRDVTSRVAFLQAGPGFANGQAQVDELRRQREEQARLLESRFGGQVQNLRNIVRFDEQFGTDNAGQLRLSDPDALLAAFRSFAEARLSELEAEAGLARQIRDFYRDTKENFERFREGIDVTRRGPRAQLDILRERQAEIRRLLPIALGPDSEAQQRALAQIQAFLPEVLQLGQSLFAPGSSAFQALLQFADELAVKLGADAGKRETAAEKRLNDAKAAAEAFKADVVPLLFLIELAAQNNLNRQFDRLVLALKGEDGLKPVLDTIARDIANLTGGGGVTQQGGAITNRGNAGGTATDFAFPAATNTAGGGSVTGAASSVTVPITIQVGDRDPEAAVDAVEAAIRRKRPQLVAEIRRAVAGGR